MAVEGVQPARQPLAAPTKTAGRVQHLASTGYVYADPYVQKARDTVPLIDATVKRVEPLMPAVIGQADKCVDVVCNAAQQSAQKISSGVLSIPSAAAGKARSVRVAASGKARTFFGAITVLSLDFLDASEALVDRALPPDEGELALEKKERAAARAAGGRLVLVRALHLPCRVPLRAMRLTFVKARGLPEMLKRSPQYVYTLTSQQLTALQTSSSRAMVSLKDSASRNAQVVWQSIMQGKQAIVVWVNGQMVVIVAKKDELQAWAVQKASSFRKKAA